MRRMLWTVLVLIATDGLSAPANAESLLVSGFDSNNVVEFDATTGAFSKVFIAAGSGGLSQAEGLAYAPNGTLLVASFGSNRVLRFDSSTGAFLGTVSSIASPTGLIVHDGIAYVSSFS